MGNVLSVSALQAGEWSLNQEILGHFVTLNGVLLFHIAWHLLLLDYICVSSRMGNNLSFIPVGWYFGTFIRVVGKQWFLKSSLQAGEWSLN
jgi:glycopeptide antibiotics resistance protein